MRSFKIHLNVLVVFVMMFAVLSSCSNENENFASNDSFIVGSWEYVFDESSGSYVLWTFKADGTGSYYEWDNGSVDGAETFTYVCDEENEKLVFFFMEEGKEIVRFSKISDTHMIVFDFFDSIENWVKRSK